MKNANAEHSSSPTPAAQQVALPRVERQTGSGVVRISRDSVPPSTLMAQTYWGTTRSMRVKRQRVRPGPQAKAGRRSLGRIVRDCWVAILSALGLICCSQGIDQPAVIVGSTNGDGGNGLNATDDGVASDIQRPDPPSGPYLEQEGQLVVELEAYSELRPSPDSQHSWELAENNFASGGLAVTAQPNVGTVNDVPEQGPVLAYPIRVGSEGTYYVHVRCFAAGDIDHSVHVGLDGSWPETAQHVTVEETLQWAWAYRSIDAVTEVEPENNQQTLAELLEELFGGNNGNDPEEENAGAPVAQLQLSAGDHELLVGMSADGVSCDQIALTTSSDAPVLSDPRAASPQGAP